MGRAIDVKGDLILTKEEWNELDNLEQRKRYHPISTEVKHPASEKMIKVDYNLAIPLQRIWNAGYRTGQSCSGGK